MTILAALLVTVTLLLALRPFASVAGLIDKPGGRKTHQGDVPVVGGIAMFAGLLVAAAGPDTPSHGVVVLLLPAALMVLVGALDDRFDLPARVRLLAHSAASVALVYGVGGGVPHLGDLLGLGQISLGPLSIPFSVVATVALINGFNMLDGLDGLAAGVGLVAFAACLAVSASAGAGAALLVSGGMVGAIGAFALFNLPLEFNRSVRTFMGDAGSTLIGFVLAAIGLILIRDESVPVSPAAFLWMLPIPIFELFSSTGRRLSKGLHPMEADANHFHHRLLKAGFSVRAIALLYLVFSVVCALVSVAFVESHVADSVIFGAFMLAFLAWTFFIRLSARLVHRLPKWARYCPKVAGH